MNSSGAFEDLENLKRRISEEGKRPSFISEPAVSKKQRKKIKLKVWGFLRHLTVFCWSFLF